MKKLLPVLLLLLVVAGCSKEKTYTENLQGSWEVYKYMLDNVDRTNLYNFHYRNYTITYSGNDFVSTFCNDTTCLDSTSLSGTFNFADNDEKLVLNYTYYTYTPVTDTSGNVIDSTKVTHAFKNEYTIFNLTKDHVQLRNDTSQLYMRKLVTE